jgi:hypothetical protein
MNAAEAWGVMAGLRQSAQETAARLAEPARMTEAEKVLRFALAGNATFTIVSLKTGTRFTFKVRAKDERMSFVSLLTGSDNENDFSYLGTIFSDSRTFRHGRKSRITEDAPSSRAFAWFWSKLLGGALPETMEFHHAGRCGRCGRKLTVPESVETGLGPECATRA